MLVVPSSSEHSLERKYVKVCSQYLQLRAPLQRIRMSHHLSPMLLPLLTGAKLLRYSDSHTDCTEQVSLT